MGDIFVSTKFECYGNACFLFFLNIFFIAILVFKISTFIFGILHNTECIKMKLLNRTFNNGALLLL